MKFTPIYKPVTLTHQQASFMNSVPLSYFMDSDNLILEDGKITGYYQLQNIAETFIHTENEC